MTKAKKSCLSVADKFGGWKRDYLGLKIVLLYRNENTAVCAARRTPMAVFGRRGILWMQRLRNHCSLSTMMS